MWRVWNIKKQQWLFWDKYKLECIKRRTSKTNIILRDAKEYLKIKSDVNLYLVTQMWENGESNVQCVWCCNNYDDFTNKTVTCHKLKTRAYTGSRFWVTHMNKKNWGEDTSKVTPPEVMCISSRLKKKCWQAPTKHKTYIYLFGRSLD